MRRLKFVVALLVLAAVLAVGRYHIVISKSGLDLVAKQQWSLKDSYLDTRDWGLADFLRHPEISKHALGDQLEGFLDRIDDGWSQIKSEFKSLDPGETKLNRERLDALKREAEQRFALLRRKVEAGTMSWEAWSDALDTLRQDIKSQIEKLRED